MGTRSITTIMSRWGEQDEFRHNASIYRHWDGYITGHGKDLYNYIKDLQIVNGISADMDSKCINGPGRLAAYLVRQMGVDGHDPDLVPEGSDMGQEFHYVLEVTYGMFGGKVGVRVLDGPVTFFGTGGDECTNIVFEGSIEEFGEFVEAEVLNEQ